MKKREENSNELIHSGEGSGMKRRSFIKLLGGGIFYLFSAMERS